MRLRSYLLASTLSITLAVSAGAQSVDYGGSIFNLTGVGNSSGASAEPGGSPGLVQEDVLKGWFQASLDSNLSINFQFDATYNTAPILPFNTTLLFANADLLNLHGNYQFQNASLRVLQFTVGRLLLSDFTSLVVSHEADGVFLDIELPTVSVNVSAGYTGLVTKGASTIELSKSDLNDYADSDVNFASPRLVELAQVAFLGLPGQRISLSAILQQDLRGGPLDAANGSAETLVKEGSTTLEPTLGGRVETQYFGAGMSGSISGKLYYDVFSYLETGEELFFKNGSYENLSFFGLLAGGGVRVPLPGFLSSSVATRVYYASGDANASTVIEGATQSFSIFTPISRPLLDNVFSPQLSNLIVVEASFTVKPLSNLGAGLPQRLQTVLQADAYFRPTTGPISEPGIPSSSTSNYLGTEADLSINFNPLSDLGFSVWGGTFFPGSAFGSGAKVQYKTGLDATLTF